jgi:hypothetical protein
MDAAQELVSGKEVPILRIGINYTTWLRVHGQVRSIVDCDG